MNYAKRIISLCGGVRALAKALGRPSSTVFSWGERGSMPDDAKAEVLVYARGKGIALEPADFFPVELILESLPPAGAQAAE